MPWLLAVVIAMAMFVPAPAGASVLVVDPADGSAYSSIGAALAAASAGDTVLVAPGVYAESLTITTPGVTLLGLGAADAVIDGGTALTTIEVKANGVRLENLALRGGTDTVRAHFVGGLELVALQVAGGSVNGVRVASSTDVVVIESTFSGGLRALHFYDVAMLSLHGIDVGSGDEHGIVVEKSSFVAIHDVSVVGRQIGIWVLDSTDVVIDSYTASEHSEGMYVQASFRVSATTLSITDSTINALRVRGGADMSFEDVVVSGAPRGIHVEDAESVRLSGITVDGVQEHGIVIEGSHAVELSSSSVTGGHTGVWVYASSGVSFDSVQVVGSSRALMLLTGSSGVSVVDSTLQDSAGWGIHLAFSPEASVSGSTISDTACDVVFDNGGSGITISATQWTDTNVFGQVSGDASVIYLCAPSPADPNDRSIPLSNSPDACQTEQSDLEWHFIITDSKQHEPPESITVVWQGLVSLDVPLWKLTGNAAHYATSAHLAIPLIQALAEVEDGWDGRFNLSHGPCLGGLGEQDAAAPINDVTEPVDGGADDELEIDLVA